jgi:hypothetical protein
VGGVERERRGGWDLSGGTEVGSFENAVGGEDADTYIAV